MFCKLRGHNSKLGINSFIILYLVRLYKGTKIEVEAWMGLMSQYCEGVINSNIVAFTWGKVKNIYANLSTIKGIINAKITKNLLCFICNNRRKHKIPSEITDFFRKEIFLTIFF